LDPNEPAWLSDLQFFTEELKTNFRTYNLVGKAEAELKLLHMQVHHQATKYFIKFQQLATCVQWGEAALCRQAYNRLAKCIKDDMVHHNKLNSLSGLGNVCKLLIHDTGNNVGKFPMKSTLLEPLETSLNTSPAHPIQTTSPEKVLPSPNRKTTTPALPRAKAQLLDRSPPLPTFPQN